MPTTALDLFDYAAARVTPDDVAAYVPDDPGYANYIRAFTRILTAGCLPPTPDFGVLETIEMN